MVLAELIGDSPGMAAVREQVGRLLGRRAEGGRLPSVLLLGETGTGKGLLARALHLASPRRSGSFVDVNCPAIPEALLEAEMFGVERGAFTGADRPRPGLFQAAHRGTLFLDEIGLVPEALQIKLLKAIEERTVRRLGRTASEPVDVWVLAATSEDLDEAMRAKRFRPDLYHRLAVVTLRLPPLRERGADVELLAAHFLARVCADYGLPRKTLAGEACRALRAYRWPGNVRELANVIERAGLLSDEAVLTAGALEIGGGLDSGPPGPARRHDGDTLRERLQRTERECLLEALQQTSWNLSHAAAWLHLPRNTLLYRMERHGLRAPPPSRRRAGLPEALAASGQAALLAPPPAASLGGGDRRRISWLRADLVGAASPASEFDTSRALEVIAEKIHGFGGQIEALSRTQVVAIFGIEPVEDAPRRAALAALAVQKAMEHARRDGAWLWSVKLGLHVHDCVLGDAGCGVAVEAESTQAAKAVLGALVGAAPLDSVLTSATAAVLLERRFELAPAPAAGGAGSAVYRLSGRERAGFGVSGRITAFVGRQQELALLESRLGSVLGGRGLVVAIIGEAGIGKSRVLLEFRQGFKMKEVSYFAGRCSSHASAIPYFAVFDIVRQICEITEADAREAIEAKARLALGRLGMGAREAGPYLLQLLGVNQEPELRGVNPELMKARTFDVIHQMVLGASRLRPCVLVVEDLHWIDKTSDELLALLVDAVPAAPILLMATYRSGYDPSWLARSYVTQVALAPLSSEDSRAVLSSALAGAPVAPEVADLIVAKADGNPFFLEELARAIGEHAEPDAASVPDTIQGVLMGRIDRLAAEDRRLLQVAAVIGKDVPVGLLQAMVEEAPAVLQQHLRQLQAADFLYETRPAPELEYVFKHTLTHEVAYGSLLPERRRALHAKAAQVLVRLSPDVAERRPESVARHLTAAALPAEAIPFWLRAGRHAIRRSANVEAVSHLGTALDLLMRTPESPERDQRELELQLALGRALITTKGYASRAVENAYERARRLCRQLGTAPQIFSASRGVWLFHLIRGDLRSAQEIGEQLLAMALKAGDALLLARAHLALGVPLFYRGRLGEARSHLEESIALYQPGGAPTPSLDYGLEPLVSSLGFLAWTLGFQGHEADSLRCVEAALRRAEELGSAFTYASALNIAGPLYQLRRDFRTSGEYAEQAIAIAREHRFPHVLGEGMWVRGRALAAAGQHEEGLKVMSEGLAMLTATGARLSATYFLTHIAETHLAAGNVEHGLAAVATGFASAERNDEQYYVPELHRVRAELLAAAPATSREAEIDFEAAVALATRQGSRVLGHRAAASFARYLRERGRVPEAERVLAERDNVCTEDSST